MSIRWLLPVLLLLLASCSRTGIVYNNADWFMYRWADGLLDARPAQRERWQALFEQALSEHRRELLPQVVVLLDRASRDVGDGLGHAGLECLLHSGRDLLRAHGQLAINPALAVLSSVDADQREHLRQQLRERDAEYREDYLPEDPVERESKRVERYLERIERWTGELTTAQTRLVEKVVGTMPDIAADWLEYRQAQQARLVALLDADDREALRAFLHAWWVEQRDRDSRLVAGVDRITTATIDLLVALDGTLDSSQRTHLLAEIGDLRDGLAKVGGEPVRLALQSAGEGDCNRIL